MCAARRRSGPIAALAYVGDAMEENPDQLCQLAGEIGLLGVRAFMFHEGRDPLAERTFREIARLTGGAYLPFDRSLGGAAARAAARRSRPMRPAA